MILSIGQILQEVKFSPNLDVFQISPCAVDLRLDTEYIFESSGHHVLRSMEEVELSKNVVGFVVPRSSTNRRSLTLDMTGIVDPGYKGSLVLPITNWNNSIMLRKGERIASIIFMQVGDIQAIKESKYHNGDGSYKPDKLEEEELLKAGDIDGLKRMYSV